jgi:nitronate monooxygenase
VSFRVVQAPMASNQPPGFAAAVCAAGAVGSVAGATLSPDALRDEIRAMPAGATYAVNLFAPPYLNEDSLQVVLDERPPVFSVTFGIVDPAPLRDAGIEVWGTATSGDEARALRDAGVDVVVAQGAEAGGHRGSFLDGFPLVPLEELLQSIDVDLPVVAAGGIVDRHDVARARELGAAGVSVGTAFLFTHECARPAAHLAALRAHDTAVTDAYTGRPMRAACDDVLQRLMRETPLPFPEQRRVSAERGPVFMGGTGARRCREQSVAELVAELHAR